MSTILNALKRLEEDRRKEKGPRAPRAMEVEADGPRRFALKAGLTVIILAVALGAAMLAWLNGGLPGIILSPQARVPEQPAAAVVTAPLEERSRNAPPTARREAETTERGEAAHPPPSWAPAAPEVVKPPASVARQTVPPVYSKELQKSPRPSPGRSPTGGRNATSDDGALQPRPRQALETDPLQPASQTAKPPETAGDRQPSATAGPSREAAPLARGLLTLQAISWSDVPSARLTIIDGRILREGETVDGYTVIQIRPEDIIVGKSGKQWKLGYDNR